MDATGFRWLDATRLIQSLGHNGLEAAGLPQRGTAEGTTLIAGAFPTLLNRPNRCV